MGLSQSEPLSIPPANTNNHGWPWDILPAKTPPLMADGSPWPLVTIVTPSYNQAEFLEEAVRSVLLQGYPNLEYMIMDGGSTDGSVEIIKKYAPFLSDWISQKDEGQSAAINAGFHRAHGAYLAWLNSDDVLLPGAITAAVESLHRNPQAGMAFAQVEAINELGQKIGIFEPVDYRFQDLLTMKIILPQQAAFFRKSVLEKTGYLRTDLHYAMDVELFIRIGAAYPILVIPDTYGQFRLSTSNKGVKNKVNWCDEFIRIVDDFFASSELSHKYHHLRPAAYGGAYYRGAHTYLETGHYTLARQWLNRAALTHAYYYRKPGWWKAQLLALLGEPGKRALQALLLWLKKNNLHFKETDWQVGIASQQALSQSAAEKSKGR